VLDALRQNLIDDPGKSRLWAIVVEQRAVQRPLD
jgi:hypothetical protein